GESGKRQDLCKRPERERLFTGRRHVVPPTEDVTEERYVRPWPLGRKPQSAENSHKRRDREHPTSSGPACEPRNREQEEHESIIGAPHKCERRDIDPGSGTEEVELSRWRDG